MGLLLAHRMTNLEGFESGDINAPGNQQMPQSGGFIVAAGMRSGSYCFQSTPFGFNSYITLPFDFGLSGEVNNARDFPFSYTRTYMDVVFNGMAAGTKGRVISFFSGAPSSLSERWWLLLGSESDPSGALLYLTNGSFTQAGTHTISTADPYKRVETFFDSKNGRIEVRVNGALDIKVSGQTVPNLDSMGLGCYTSYPAGGYAINFDDIAIEANLAATPIDWPGPGSVLRMYQDGDAENESTAWLDQGAGSVNIYQSIDETVYDEDTTYIRSGTRDKRYLADFQTAAAAGISGNIYAVKGVSRFRNEGGSPRHCQLLQVTGGGTIQESGPLDLTSSYQSRQSVVYPRPPGTPNDEWVEADLDALRMGSILRFNIGTVYCRVTQDVIQVAYDATVAAAFQPKINPPVIGGKRTLINPRELG